MGEELCKYCRLRVPSLEDKGRTCIECLRVLDGQGRPIDPSTLPVALPAEFSLYGDLKPDPPLLVEARKQTALLVEIRDLLRLQNQTLEALKNER